MRSPARVLWPLATVIVFFAAVASQAAEPASFQPATAQNIRKTMLREILDLQQKEKLQTMLYEQQTRQIAHARDTLLAAEAAYREAARQDGPESPVAKLASQKVTSATLALYGQISEREHVRYGIRSLEEVIQQRRLSLGFQQGGQDQSVWK